MQQWLTGHLAWAFVARAFAIAWDWLKEHQWTVPFSLVGGALVTWWAQITGLPGPLLVVIGLAVGVLILAACALVLHIRARLTRHTSQLSAVDEQPTLTISPQGLYPQVIQGWAYYSFLVSNEQWRRPQNFYGVRGSLLLTPPMGEALRIDNALFRLRVTGETLPTFTDEVTKLEISQSAELIIVFCSVSGYDPTGGKEVKFYTATTYPPNIPLEKEITYGEWMCMVTVSWVGGGRLQKRYKLEVRPQRPINIVGDSTQP